MSENPYAKIDREYRERREREHGEAFARLSERAHTYEELRAAYTMGRQDARSERPVQGFYSRFGRARDGNAYTLYDLVQAYLGAGGDPFLMELRIGVSELEYAAAYPEAYEA